MLYLNRNKKRNYNRKKISERISNEFYTEYLENINARFPLNRIISNLQTYIREYILLVHVLLQKQRGEQKIVILANIRVR